MTLAEDSSADDAADDHPPDVTRRWRATRSARQRRRCRRWPVRRHPVRRRLHRRIAADGARTVALRRRDGGAPRQDSGAPGQVARGGRGAAGVAAAGAAGHPGRGRPRPGELIGWGPVHAELARAIATTPGASWWYVLTSPDGSPLAIGQVRSRPDGPARRRPRISRTTGLATGQPGHPRAPSPDSPTRPGGTGSSPRSSPRPTATPAHPTATRPRGYPGRHCAAGSTCGIEPVVFPGCRVPAHRADADHSVEHAEGGPTIDTNLSRRVPS